MKTRLEKIYMGIIFVFMYAPILTLIVLSFNSSKSRARWGGFTLQWYANLFSDNAVLNAMANTLIIALISTVAATVIGTMTCVGLMGLRRRSRAFIMGVTNIPMINADIVTGISLMLLFKVLHFETGFITVLLAHITFNIPYVMLAVLPRMKTINPNVYEAAVDLGAGPLYAFRKAVLPDLMPAVLSGSLMAFTMSIDDFIITYFTKGSGFDTLSTKIYNEVKRGIQPEIYALSSIIFVMVIILLAASNSLRQRQGRTKRNASLYKVEKKISKGQAVLIGAASVCIILLAMYFGGVFTRKSNQLFVYNAGEYIDPEVIEMFEEETGIEVVYDEFETLEIMYAKMVQDDAAYDVICPSDYMVAKMISSGMLRELDLDKIPNRKNIGEQYLESARSFDPENKYCVPYCWGTVGILYNKNLVDDPVDSWDILWDPKYSGQILMQDSIRDAFMVALERRGYSVNTTDPEELEEAAADLIEQKPLVQAYVIDQARDKMIGGEAAMAVIYSGEVIYAQRENPDLCYSVPKEGSNVWIDGWVVTKRARNPEAAMKWIDFMCRPDIALMNFDFITYSTPNTAARDMIEDEDIRNSEVAYPAEDVLERCDTYSYLGEEGDALYNRMWKKVKSGS
ncbi:MAG TPA: spermidine/putrescine ABC transporter permease/substrate-binding protein PotCD [Lachnospiraceae bacterium]|nr:spermidine/putrescine ABC transporter permease/substrate-binding protein PotCD [Lachnospiraceae bacterium]HBB58685.1 spermidine/putrescine ABC transporter permease/substrate-binding protein PotCD [Lachnospiraceae bacterium]